MHDSRCKNCGAPVVVSNESRFVRCEYCGSTFELDPNRAMFANLYSAADDAWDRKDFDEALKLYLQITEQDNLQSEAHWGAALCRYGIAYEIDPVSGEKKPTCNRTNTTSIFEDKNYISAIKHASPENKQKYLNRASEIDRISLEFLKIVESEPPYDVFISYKRTDERGLKTIDAEYAMKLYIFLKDRGIKVFFAEETLKNVAGSLYEPYIFAALSSAKVMLLMGSSKENIESVWVKNEWQRFLKQMETAPQKALIPAFIGDPYQVLPQRLQPLQAFNAGSPAFVEEILENIKKKMTDSAGRISSADDNAGQATLGSLLERAFMFVSDGEFEKSSKQLEKVLDIDPKCAEAYFCSLMVEFRIKKEAQFADLLHRIDLSPNFKKIMMFGSEGLKKKISAYSDTIMSRLNEKELKRQELQKKKEALVDMVAHADNALGAINKTRIDIKVKIADEESGLAALKESISVGKSKLAEQNTGFAFPILFGALIIVLDAVALLFASEQTSNWFFFLTFLLPATVLFTILTFSNCNIGGPFIVCGIWFILFVVILVINGGGIIETVLGIFYDFTLGLLFGDKMVLTPDTLQTSLQMSFFFTAQLVYVIGLIVSIVQQVRVTKELKQYNALKNQIANSEMIYNSKVQQNTTLAALRKALAEQDSIYVAQFNSFKAQLTQENNEYVAFAKKTGQEPEAVLPHKYL